MSRQNKAVRTAKVAQCVTVQHKQGNKVGNPAPKHNKVNRIGGSTSHRAFYLKGKSVTGL